ncbi:MAG TPA: septation protein A [Rhizomicrobium sp.]|nr:septation protein A [Rhizomicrobium sp.]
MSEAAKPRKLPPLARFALDIGPLAIFFAVLRLSDIFAATAVFMVAIVAALMIGFLIERRLSPMPIVTGVVVLIFGGLTLYLHDKTFIKLKPTIIYTIFAILLAGGIATGRNFIKTLFDHAFHLTDDGWRILTYRWIVFFVAMAVLNEIVWRNFSDTFWAGFKLFGAIPLTLVFAMAQTPLVLRYEVKQEPES